MTRKLVYEAPQTRVYKLDEDTYEFCIVSGPQNIYDEKDEVKYGTYSLDIAKRLADTYKVYDAVKVFKPVKLHNKWFIGERVSFHTYVRRVVKGITYEELDKIPYEGKQIQQYYVEHEKIGYYVPMQDNIPEFSTEEEVVTYMKAHGIR